MNTKHLLDEILDKWPAKVICLIVAIFLYFFHQASIIDSKTLVVPLKILENGVVMQVGSAPKSVSVVVRGSAEDIKLVDPSEITAYVSVDDITQKGQYTLPVQLSLSDALLVLDPFEVKLKDEKLTLYVDRKAIKYVPLMPSVVGEVAHGYEVESITMNPSTIEITGPESVINSTQSVYTTRVNVSNAETNFTVETSYQNLSSIITVVDEGPYKATVTVVPVEMEKDFEDVEVEYINLAEGLEISGEKQTVFLKLSGDMPVLENYILSKHAVQINLRDITEPGTYELPVRYSIPANLKLVEKSDDILSVTIDKKIEEKSDSETAVAGEGE